MPPERIAAGGIPRSGWRPAFAVAPEGRLWLAGGRGNGDPALLRSEDGGVTWSASALPARARALNFLHRTSATTGYLATRGEDQHPALWRTTDGGLAWTPVPTPHDQGVQHVGPGRTRVEEIATVDTLLLVREHGKVFVTSARTIRWRSLPGLDHIASEPGSDFLFVLSDSLDASLLDAGLRQVWRGTRPLAEAALADVEQVKWRRNAGYVSMGRGSLHEIRDGRIRTLTPPPR
jgi:hypothetical protein